MPIEQSKMQTQDNSDELIVKIAKEFPEFITEAKDTKGNLQRVVDFDKLRQALDDRIIQGEQERYQINWPGKRESLFEANAPTTKTLRPSRKESVNFRSTKNLFIEGDNLEALKLLMEGYLGRVRMIYIDPPYNTGSDFVYSDRYQCDEKEYLARSGQRSADGGRLVSNTQSHGRFHSDWLSMIYPRLRLARQLLADNGLLFVSIDDNERANLQKVCEEIFGRDNFLGCFIWKRRSGAMDARTNLSEDHEYVLVYSKYQATLNGVERTFDRYSNPDNDPRGPWISDNLSAGKPGGDTYYSICDPQTGSEFYPPKGRYWPYSRETMAQKIAEGRVIFPRSPEGAPMLKRFASEAIRSTIPVSSWIERPGSRGGQSTIVAPMNSSASKALKSLFGGKYFSFPKPVELMQALIEQGTDKDALVMDFFAGSATTAEAILRCNALDGGSRRFILVQLPESLEENSEAAKRGFTSISDLARERIRLAGTKIVGGECHPDWNRDVGFRVFRIDTSNMKDVFYTPDTVSQEGLFGQIDNIKDDRSDEDLLFQVLLDWGVDLSLPVRSSKIAGRTVYFVDEDALAACFEVSIDEDFVRALAEHKPLRVVFRDSSYGDDNTKINVEQIFRLISPTTEVKTL